MGTTSKPSYTVRAERDGNWWGIEVVGVEGAFSQAKRLDQVAAMAREVIALLLEVPEDSFDLTVEFDLAPEWTAMLDGLRAMQQAQVAAAQSVGAQLRAVAKSLHAAGLPVRDVGSLMDLSPQRISQLTNS